MNTNMNVTSIADLKNAASAVVELPPFAEGTEFFARLKRPSLMMMVKTGKIPNQLLAYANQLFVKGGVNANDMDAMSGLMEIMEIMCEACFVEPTYQQIKDAGIELTDEQLMFVFNYSQNGVRALSSFRQQQASAVSHKDGTRLGSKTE